MGVDIILIAPTHEPEYKQGPVRIVRRYHARYYDKKKEQQSRKASHATVIFIILFCLA